MSCRRQNLSFNLNKTVVVPFQKKKRNGTSGITNYPRCEIGSCGKYEILGILSKKRLAWNLHFENNSQKAKILFGICQKISKMSSLALCECNVLIEYL